jgi:hypothetical protein
MSPAVQPKEYGDYGAELRTDHPELATEFARSDSIENVLLWMKRQDLAPGSVEIVGQDEFSYDFLIRLGADGKWLAFGVN